MASPTALDLARELGHERLLVVQEPRVGLTAVIAIHDTTLGRAIGGTRMRLYPSLDAAVEDALRLSHAMTAKAAFAGMSCGGGKAVIVGDPLTDKTPELLLAYGRVVEELGGGFFTGGDMGIDQGDLAVIARATSHVGEMPTASRIDASDLTAIGIVSAMEAVAARLDKPFATCRVALQGLGEVGGRLAEKLAAKGVDLVVTDTVRERSEAVVRATGARPVAPEEIFAVDCDIFSPNAAGAAVTDAVVAGLRCRAIVGAANNPLASTAIGEELARRGILYAPDYVVNAGGLLSVLFETGELDEAGILARVERIGADLAALLDRAERDGEAPFRVAERVVAERLSAKRAGAERSPAERLGAEHPDSARVARHP